MDWTSKSALLAAVVLMVLYNPKFCPHGLLVLIAVNVADLLDECKSVAMLPNSSSSVSTMKSVLGTPNPRLAARAKTVDENEPARGEVVLPPQHPETTRIAGAFTLSAQTEARDSRVFRPNLSAPAHQDSVSRARFLDALYEEFSKSSLKKDPALRKADTKDNCLPLRGHESTERTFSNW